MWILSPFWDTLFFIGSPLLAMALLLPPARFWPPAEYAAFLLAIFTFGHHLPGFLRAYGDRGLFERHRLRLLLAPPVVLAITAWFAWRDWHGLLFVAFTWDIWHVLMQHYGFMRIYDAKSGVAGPETAWLDRALCLSWYLAFIFSSPHYVHDLLLRAHSSGLPAFTPAALAWTRWTLLAASGLVSVAYLAHHVNAWRTGRPVSFRKLASLACFLGATYYLYVVYENFLVGFAVWSAYHSIQYYAIVWAFNRNRVASDRPAAAFLRFLFRPRLALVATYVAVIAAYGSINLAANRLEPGTLQATLMAVIVTSGILHYYYDGFIWKLREPKSAGWQPALVPAVALGVLALVEIARPFDELRVRTQVVHAAPKVVEGRLRLGDALRDRGQVEQAAIEYAEAARLFGDSAEASHKLGLALASLHRDTEAIAAFEQAVLRRPSMTEAHYNLASLLARRGNTERALHHYRAAFPADDDRMLRDLERQPEAAGVLNNFALGLIQAGERPRAIAILRRAADLAPRDAAVRLNLGSALALEGSVAEARRHYQVAVETGDPRLCESAERALRLVGK